MTGKKDAIFFLIKGQAEYNTLQKLSGGEKQEIVQVQGTIFVKLRTIYSYTYI